MLSLESLCDTSTMQAASVAIACLYVVICCNTKPSRLCGTSSVLLRSIYQCPTWRKMQSRVRGEGSPRSITPAIRPVRVLGPNPDRVRRGARGSFLFLALALHAETQKFVAHVTVVQL